MPDTRNPYAGGGRSPYDVGDVKDPYAAPDDPDAPEEPDAPDAPEEEPDEGEEDPEPEGALRKAARAVSEKATSRHRAVKPETDS